MEEQNFKSIDELERFEAHLADFGIKPDGQLKERLAALRETLKRRQAAIDSSLYEQMKGQSKFPVTREFEQCVEGTVDRLLAGDGDEPGLLLGNIQCGKTNTFENIIALAFDRGIEVCVILTKGTKTLASQTLARAKADFAFAKKNDMNDGRVKVEVSDIMELRHNGVSKTDTNGTWCRQIIVCKKESRNIQSLIDLFEIKSPNLKEERTLIVDDEADFASRVFRGCGVGTELAKISNLIDRFRKIPTYCRYLQVTATPYSLYLQPDGTIKNPKEGSATLAQPFRPRFTMLVPTHDKYIGGKQYYEDSQDEDSMYSHLYRPVSDKCVEVLSNRNRRYINNTYRSDNLSGLTRAVVGYFLAAAIRSVQEAKRGKRFRSSCLIHVQVAKKNHEWQSELICKMIDDIRKVLLSNARDECLESYMHEGYQDFCESSRKGHEAGLLGTEVKMPTYEDTMAELKMLIDSDYQVKVVNSDNEVQAMLDENGQLKLQSSLNIFVGGSILDRGITVGNMLCFFYGRSPKKLQMDTVLQHARMYGARPLEDMAVTRFYTTKRLHTELQKIHEIDSHLRECFTTVENNEIVPSDAIVIGCATGVKPCAANKIKFSETKVVKKNSRLLPVGFQTGTKEEIAPIVSQIDRILALQPGFGSKQPFMIEAKVAAEILRLIEKTYVYSDKWENKYLEWHAGSMIATINYSLQSAEDKKIWCQYRDGRQMPRKREDGRFIDSPDAGNTDLAPARELATDRPVLTLLRQEGAKKGQGWNDAPFYWPVLLTPSNFSNVMFALNVQKEMEDKEVCNDEEYQALLRTIPKEEILDLPIKMDFFAPTYFGFKTEEMRVLKPQDAAKYLKEDSHGNFLLADGVDPKAIDADIFSGNDGEFPFVFRDFKYIRFRCSFTSGSEGKLLVRLADGPDRLSVICSENSDLDILTDKQGDQRKYVLDNIHSWTIFFNIAEVIGPRQPELDKWRKEHPGEFEEMRQVYLNLQGA